MNDKSDQKQPGDKQQNTPRSLSMHDGIPDWYDCCTCEAEPYWTEAAEELEDNKDEKGR